ncbi:hypothetical protein CHU98_g7514 [Xylaria longipes]|nr:hypothetical protein CHU98_g7514 [Xylaria longipes]
MSGVRNLRAMFEQKGDSLPDRGRSPGPGGFATPSPSASPRPLSKVRTSFVAIEKDGRIGLRREPSRDSETVSSRRFSNDTDTSTPQPISEKSDVFSDNMASTVASFKTNLSHEAIPESPRQDTPVKFSPKKEFKSPLEPNANPDKVTDEEEPRTKMLSSNPTESSAARLGGTVLNGGISDALNGTPSTTAKAKAPGASKPAPKTVAPVSTAKTAARAPKSPLTTKAPSGKEPTKATVSSANPKKVTATKGAASKPAAIDLPPSGTGFVKPKPKSPTRPVKLPSSLTTHTASSVQKTGTGSAAPAPRRSLSRASGNAQHLSVNPTTQRSPSRNSVSTTGTTTAKTLKHKASNANVGRSRPSIGPPPKPAAKEQPAPKKETQVDEGFLARMMRPTASSAKKTSEKAPVTPPRKRSAPVAPIKRLDTEAEKNAKKAGAKLQASSTQAKTTKNSVKPVAAKEQPTAKEIAPAVAQAETAETVIEKAKLSTDTAEAPVVSDEKAEADATAKDDSAIVAQETADDNIEATKTPTDNSVTAEVPSNEEAKVAEVEPVPEPATAAEVDGIEHVASVPAVSEDPLKVEDIEDTVQEAQEPSHQLQSIEPAVEVSPVEDIPEVKESIPVSAEEPVVEVAQTVDEPLISEETVADVKETAEEAKTEAPATIEIPHDGTGEDRIDEAAIKDGTAAAL